MHYILWLLLVFSFSAHAQVYILKGNIKDTETGEYLPFASIADTKSNKGVSSDDRGDFSITLTKGAHTLMVTYIGYAEKTLSLNIRENTSLDILLTPLVYTTEEVVVGGVRTDKNVQESRMSVMKLSTESLKSMPAFMGEVDILKTIQLMPGVQSGGEGSTGFYVRGGGPDQNLILLDGATIYNASHLFGFFSVFNADAIADVELFKGGMPAEYGGRISSVLDIDMTEGDMQTFKGNGGIGTISARLSLQGPIVKDKVSFIVSGRRTYIDALIAPFLSDESAFKGSGYFFYDLTGKITYRVNDKNTLYLSGYYGKDEFSFIQKDDGISLKMPWGNGMASARWNHVFGDKLFSNFSLLMTDYQFSTTTVMTTNAETGETSSFAQYSGIRDYTGKLDYTWVPNDDHIIKFGASYTLHRFTPNTIKTDFAGFEGIEEGTSQYAHESSIYLSDDWKINQRLTLYGGLRASMYNQFGPFTRYVKDEYLLHNTDTIYYDKGESVATYGSLEPRLSLKFSTGETSSVKASFMRNKQYIHLASLSASTLPTDLWVSSTDRVKPSIGQQYAVGFFKNFNHNMFETSVELYYKDMWNMIEYADGALPGDEINDNVDNYFIFGNGQSYGAELFLRKNVGRLTGWLGYTYSKTDRQFDDINDGERFDAKYDRTHDLSFTASYQFSKKLEASLVYVYSTGNTTTLPVARYTINGAIVDEFGPRNWYRLEAFHRLDMSVTYHFEKKSWLESSLNFSIYNVYNRKNPYFVYFDTEGNVDDNTFQIQAKKVALFPMLPSLTWNFSF